MFFSKNETNCCLDWNISCQNFECGDALQDAIFSSLHTEARNPSCGGTGGWWQSPSKGSLLHTISGNKTSETLRLAEDYARDALQWLENDGIVTDLEVVAKYAGNHGFDICISITKPSTCEFILSATDGQFGWVWNDYITRN